MASAPTKAKRSSTPEPTRSTRDSCCISGRSVRADDGARHDQLDAPILLSSRRRTVGCDWVALAEPSGADRGGRDPLLHQIRADRLRAPLGELLVVLVSADAIRVTLH